MKTSRRNAIASSLKAATVAIVAAPGKLLASIAPGPRPDAPAVIADLVGRFKSPWSAVEYLASGLGCEAEGDDDVSPEECRRLGIYYDDLGNEARARLFEDRGDHAAAPQIREGHELDKAERVATEGMSPAEREAAMRRKLGFDRPADDDEDLGDDE